MSGFSGYIRVHICRVSDNGKNLIPINFLYMLIEVQSEISLNARASVRISNSEIQCEFRDFREDFCRRMNSLILVSPYSTS